jgi:hypothetical protein
VGEVGGEVMGNSELIFRGGRAAIRPRAAPRPRANAVSGSGSPPRSGGSIRRIGTPGASGCRPRQSAAPGEACGGPGGGRGVPTRGSENYIRRRHILQSEDPVHVAG